MSSSAGWVWQGGKLLWSSNAGQSFKDITPPLHTGQAMEDVTFYDGLDGWVTIQGAPTHSGAETSLDVAATGDGGKSWVMTPIWPNDDFLLNSYAGKATMSFVTPERGFALFQLTSGSASSGGALFSTEDAGKTWTKVSITVYGTIHFITPDIGWLVGGVSDRHVLRTADGGLTWKELTLPLPPDIKPVNSAYFANEQPIYDFSYQNPSFSGLETGTLEVVYANYNPNGTKDQKTGTLATTDGGLSWQWFKALSVPSLSPVLAKTLDHSAPPSLTLSGNEILIKTPTGVERQSKLPSGLPISRGLAIRSAEFSDSSRGWILIAGDLQAGEPQFTALLSTSDGGLTFQTLLQAQSPLSPKLGRTLNNNSVRGWSDEFGIDACNIESPTITNSLYGPYFAEWYTIGFYLANGETSNVAGCISPTIN